LKRTKLNKVSSSQVIKTRNVSKYKKALIRRVGERCFICGKNTHVDLVHIIRRSYSSVLYDSERNMILGCRTCHELFDDGDASQLLKYKSFTAILKRMKTLDEFYYNRYVSKRKLE